MGLPRWIPSVCAFVVKALNLFVQHFGRSDLIEVFDRLTERFMGLPARTDAEALAEALAKALKDNEALMKGIRPVVEPTQKQISAARQRVEYDPKKFHIAVCGGSGSGKSSLINAFRGLESTDEGAAEVGANECTTTVTRYPDPRTDLPYSRFVWYDIPGAGTPNVPDWQYFNDQGLFVFDFIVIVYDVRFTGIDVTIIRNCLVLGIPFFVVRSKADQHIRNMTDNLGEHQTVVKRFVSGTISNFSANIKAMEKAPEFDEQSRKKLQMLNPRVYIVSAPTLRGLFHTTTSKGTTQTLQKSSITLEHLLNEGMLWIQRVVQLILRYLFQTPEQSTIIDENMLIEDMLRHGDKWRCSEKAT